MLEVEYKGTERYTRLSQPEVVDGILRGRIDDSSRARRPNPDWTNKELTFVAAGTVFELLNSQERAILSDRLLSEVHRFYTASNTGLALLPKAANKAAQARAIAQGDVPAAQPPLLSTEPVGLHRLHECAERLAKWKWPDVKLELRVLFLRAWLTELTGDVHRAREYYELYLKRLTELCGKLADKKDPLQAQLEFTLEPNLNLLAINNFAVLSLEAAGLQQFRPQHLRMIARLAIQRLLPGACLSLLNLHDLAWEHRDATGDDTVCESIRNVILNEYALVAKMFLGSKGKEQPPKDSAKGPSSTANESAKNNEEVKPDDRYRAAAHHWMVLHTIRERTVKLAKEQEAREKKGAEKSGAATATPAAEQANSKKTTEPAKAAKPLDEELENRWRQFSRIAGDIAYRSSSSEQAKIIEELQLWPSHTMLLFKAPPSRYVKVDELSAVLARHAGYAEAVKILYPRDLDAVASQQPRAPQPTGPIAANPLSPDDFEARVRAMIDSGDLDAAERALDDGRQSS